MTEEPKLSVEQIRYVLWGSHKPEHAWYWNTVDGIAWFIGRALEAEGICVAQTKEKFGRVCVYLSAGDDEDAALSTFEHRCAYRFVYGMALTSWPHLRQAILDGADYPKLACGEHSPEEEPR